MLNSSLISRNNIMGEMDCKKRKAFTLIELLVVISIIAVLMSVLLPALTKVREQAKQIMGATRQKDLGLSLNLYSQDWKQKLPMAELVNGEYTRLPYKLAPYYDSIDGTTSGELFDCELLRCPNDKRKSGAVGSYGYNVFYFEGLYTNSGRVERSSNDIRQSAKLPLLCCLNGDTYDSIAGNAGGQKMVATGPHPSAGLDYNYLGGVTPQNSGRFSYFGPAPMHGKECNMLMADFHVEGVNVCVDGEYPWISPLGSVFHPSGATGTRAKSTK